MIHPLPLYPSPSKSALKFDCLYFNWKKGRLSSSKFQQLHFSALSILGGQFAEELQQSPKGRVNFNFSKMVIFTKSLFLIDFSIFNQH